MRCEAQHQNVVLYETIRGNIIPIYIARHGQSTWNAQKRWAGHDDPPLTDLGREQAKNACVRFSLHQFSSVISSPLLRARETAAIIAHTLQIDLMDPIPEFNEIHAGNLSGLTSDEIRAKYPELVQKWESGLPIDMPDGETWDNFVQRVLSGMSYLKPYLHSNLLLIAHEGVLRAIAYQLGEKICSYQNLEGRWFNPSV